MAEKRSVGVGLEEPKNVDFDPLDPHNEFILRRLNKMADIELAQNNFKGAVPLLKSVWEGHKKNSKLGSSASVTMESELKYLNAKFYVVFDGGRGDVEEAIKCFEESFQLQNKLRNVAALLNSNSKLSTQELEGLEKVHRARVNGFRCIILMKQGRVDEARELYGFIFHTFCEYLGEDHPETIGAYKMGQILAKRYGEPKGQEKETGSIQSTPMGIDEAQPKAGKVEESEGGICNKENSAPGGLKEKTEEVIKNAASFEFEKKESTSHTTLDTAQNEAQNYGRQISGESGEKGVTEPKMEGPQVSNTEETGRKSSQDVGPGDLLLEKLKAPEKPERGNKVKKDKSCVVS